MAWLKGLALGATTLALLAIGLYGVGARRWAASTGELLTRLEATRLPPGATTYDTRELDGLPAPVRRYFEAVLEDGQPIITAVRVNHAGSFNLSETGEAWKPFISAQRVLTRRPGFVWDGRIDALPGVPVRVHDAYLAGEGVMHPAVLGLITLADLRGAGELAQGELMRYIAEAAWYPTALLPSQGVRWQALDEHSARATLVDGTIETSLTFHFSRQGFIESVRAEARGRSVGGRVVMTPWEGRWSNVQAVAGLHVPMTGEVAWLTPEGRRPYWRGTITSIDYDFATPR